MRDFVFTSTSVTEGHPDKLCDRVADAIVDRVLAGDADRRILAECAVAPGAVFVSTYSTGDAPLDVAEIVRSALTDAGYGSGDFSPARAAVMTSFGKLDAPSPGSVPDIAALPASNNITLFGYACRQSETLMPMPIALAHALAARLDATRRGGASPYVHPDGQAQVAIEYRDRRPVRIAGVTLLAPPVKGLDDHDADALREAVLEEVVVPTLREEAGLPFDVNAIAINPHGETLTGGPSRHSGLTGRKTDADAYGAYCRQAGTALSGKDPWRIDRTGTYAARHAAKTVVAAGLAEECEVQLSYSMGRADPTSIELDTFGSGQQEDRVLSAALRRVFDFRPGAIASAYRLAELPNERPGGFFAPLAAYGHMGREDLDVPWEKTDRTDALRSAL